MEFSDPERKYYCQLRSAGYTKQEALEAIFYDRKIREYVDELDSPYKLEYKK